jgi:hypothetical protein
MARRESALVAVAMSIVVVLGTIFLRLFAQPSVSQTHPASDMPISASVSEGRLPLNSLPIWHVRFSGRYRVNSGSGAAMRNRSFMTHSERIGPALLYRVLIPPLSRR